MTSSDTDSTGRPDRRSVLTLAVVVAIVGGLFLAGRIVPAPTLLPNERRAAARAPSLSVGSVLDTSFMKGFENYAADAFPLREPFRTLHAATVLKVFGQTDKSGLYEGAAGLGSLDPVKPASVELAADKIRRVADSLPGLHIYYGLIPDKSTYAGRYLPGFDAAQAQSILDGRLAGLTAVPLTDALSADAFYRTDLHWDQARLGPVVDALGRAMGFVPDLGGFSSQDAGTFRGAYAGQWALPVAPDTMTYLTAPGVTAQYLDPVTRTMTPGPVYDPGAITGIDPYNLFLGGPQPLVVLTNPQASSDRQLFWFRDSFSSSLAPLLTSVYAKITLIDLRYISTSALSGLVDFPPGSDVLFLYSSQVLNNAGTLLVS